MKQLLAPKKIKKTSGKEAWYYREAKGIEIYIHTNGLIVSARIPRAELKAWINQTAKEPA